MQPAAGAISVSAVLCTLFTLPAFLCLRAFKPLNYPFFKSCFGLLRTTLLGLEPCLNGAKEVHATPTRQNPISCPRWIHPHFLLSPPIGSLHFPMRCSLQRCQGTPFHLRATGLPEKLASLQRSLLARPMLILAQHFAARRPRCSSLPCRISGYCRQGKARE